MMITDLPEDLVEEILSRVPATSLKRLRAACKQWNGLFKDKRFAKKHFAKAAKEFQLLMLKEKRVYSITVNFHRIVFPSIKFKGGHSLKDSYNNTWNSGYITQVFHCDGLILCINDDYSIVVWNPVFEETRWIQPKTVYKEYTWFALGYQNTSSSCRSYKILKCWFPYVENHQVVMEFEIFELSSCSWRVLDLVKLEYIIKFSTGVSLKGNTYWLAYKNNEGSRDRVLLCFDFLTETFRRLCLPRQDLCLHTMALSVVREEKLLLLHQSIETLKLDIWVTRNIDQTNDLSWRKFLAVDLYTHNCKLSRYVSFFIEEEKKVALCIGKTDKPNVLCIIGKNGKYREFSLKVSMMPPFVFNYVPSMVHIQQG